MAGYEECPIQAPPWRLQQCQHFLSPRILCQPAAAKAPPAVTIGGQRIPRFLLCGQPEQLEQPRRQSPQEVRQVAPPLLHLQPEQIFRQLNAPLAAAQQAQFPLDLRLVKTPFPPQFRRIVRQDNETGAFEQQIPPGRAAYRRYPASPARGTQPLYAS